MMNHDWVLKFTDRRGREYSFCVLDVGLPAVLDWQRALDSERALQATSDLLLAHVLGDEWHRLTTSDAFRLASLIVRGEATEGN